MLMDGFGNTSTSKRAENSANIVCCVRETQLGICKARVVLYNSMERMVGLVQGEKGCSRRVAGIM